MCHGSATTSNNPRTRPTNFFVATVFTHVLSTLASSRYHHHYFIYSSSPRMITWVATYQRETKGKSVRLSDCALSSSSKVCKLYSWAVSACLNSLTVSNRQHSLLAFVLVWAWSEAHLRGELDSEIATNVVSKGCRASNSRNVTANSLLIGRSWLCGRGITDLTVLSRPD